MDDEESTRLIQIADYLSQARRLVENNIEMASGEGSEDERRALQTEYDSIAQRALNMLSESDGKFKLWLAVEFYAGLRDPALARLQNRVPLLPRDELVRSWISGLGDMPLYDEMEDSGVPADRTRHDLVPPKSEPPPGFLMPDESQF